MKRLSKQKLLVIIVFNLIIAVAYYIDNLDANYSELSSDIQNIIPVAQKFDNPELFQDDLYLDDINNVKYYTPFYVQSLRFIATFTNYNYVQAVNVLGFICHVTFGILWFFLLFRFVNNFWVAFLVSILIRGVIWLPGLEIWGISDLWTIMPRTVYISLLPLPFLILSNSFSKVLLASFLIGLIFNFHPITGLGGILLFISFLILSSIYFQKKERFTLRNLFLVLVTVALGMIPFVFTYFGKTSSEVTYSIEEFNKAFSARIPDYFNQPFQFLKQWLQLKTLFFILPLIVFYVLSYKNQIQHKKAKLLVLLTVILILIPTISVPVEQLVNKLLGLNLRLSFQLIRVQKVAVIPGFFAWAFILERIINTNKNRLKYAPYVVGTYLVLLVFSQSVWLKKVPFFGEDISKTILPHNLSAFSTEKDTELAIDRMAKYINKNTNSTDILCASYIYRGATKRSVVFDGKGASMLIEGNPQQFILWHKRQETINSLNNTQAIVDYLKQFNVDYFVTRNKNVPAILIHTEGSISLYKL
ncbi:hypothetical protein [Olleya aquimaris]|uniref:Glycosyltransferase RgtA/B/C/D-like domain-containing protein n=1 Tax=Olleya aquimaris TaxID=639310 RepID=A0A327RLD1_9FLAO|nr:hypothetical protein [Olleya aquimaris]RAJ17005.1 hypothetical protein LY08_00783 [Olleya aquimaris]